MVWTLESLTQIRASYLANLVGFLHGLVLQKSICLFVGLMASNSLFFIDHPFYFSKLESKKIGNCSVVDLLIELCHDNLVETNLILCCYAPNDDITALCMGWKAQ